MRRCCKIYKCAKQGDICCADCDNRICLNRCLNSPERCGCVLAPPEPRRRRETYDHEAIYRLVLKGMTNDQVADIIGCAPSTVGKVAREHGIFRPRGGQKHGER